MSPDSVSMAVASPCTKLTPEPASSSSKRGATSQQETVPVVISYSIGKKTNRSDLSMRVTRGAQPSSQPSAPSFNAVYRPPNPPPTMHTSGRPSESAAMRMWPRRGIVGITRIAEPNGRKTAETACKLPSNSEPGRSARRPIAAGRRASKKFPDLFVSKWLSQPA
eukprot:scaffold1415_cov117-Isochrysis_galbana.AAC.7